MQISLRGHNVQCNVESPPYHILHDDKKNSIILRPVKENGETIDDNIIYISFKKKKIIAEFMKPRGNTWESAGEQEFDEMVITP